MQAVPLTIVQVTKGMEVHTLIIRLVSSFPNDCPQHSWIKQGSEVLVLGAAFFNFMIWMKRQKNCLSDLEMKYFWVGWVIPEKTETLHRIFLVHKRNELKITEWNLAETAIKFFHLKYRIQMHIFWKGESRLGSSRNKY